MDLDFLLLNLPEYASCELLLFLNVHNLLLNDNKVLEISTHPFPIASVKSIKQVQIIDHLPIWREQVKFFG